MENSDNLMSPALSLRRFLGSQGEYIWSPDGSWSSKQKQNTPSRKTRRTYLLRGSMPFSWKELVTSGPRGERGRAGVGGVAGCFPPPGVARSPMCAVGLCVCGGCRQEGERGSQRGFHGLRRIRSRRKRLASS